MSKIEYAEAFTINNHTISFVLNDIGRVDIIADGKLISTRVADESADEYAQDLIRAGILDGLSGSALADALNKIREAKRRVEKKAVALSVSAAQSGFRFSNIKAEHIGKVQAVRAFLAAESAAKAVPVRFKARCRVCGREALVSVDINDPKAVYDLIVAKKKPEPEAEECIGGRPHKWEYEEQQPPLRYVEIWVRDSVADKQSPQTSYQTYHGYLLGDETPSTKDVMLLGVPLRHPKTNDIEFLVLKAADALEELNGFHLTDDDAKRLKEYFGKLQTFDDFINLAKKNNPYIAGRELAKLASLLAWVSPAWLLVNNRMVRGALHVLFFGDARTGKGSIARYLQEALGLGYHAVGETSSRTGIAYTIDNEHRTLIWGVLVEADRALVVLEAMHLFSPEDTASLREVLTQQKIEVRRAITAEAQARVRIIADTNTRAAMNEYLYTAQALRDIEFFKDQVDITRWDIFVPFRSGDVDASEMAEAQLTGQEDKEFLENLKKLVLFAWSRRAEDIIFEDVANAREAYQELFAKYHDANVPVIHEESLLQLLRIAASFAVLSFSVSGEKVIVTKAHVELAKRLIEEMIEQLEVEEYKSQKASAELTPEERERFVEELSTSVVAQKCFWELAQGPKTSAQLAALTGHDASHIRRTLAVFEQLKVIERTAKGYKLTPLGVRTYKDWLSANRTDRTDATAPGHPPSQNDIETDKTGLFKDAQNLNDDQVKNGEGGPL